MMKCKQQLIFSLYYDIHPCVTVKCTVGTWFYALVVNRLQFCTIKMRQINGLSRLNDQRSCVCVTREKCVILTGRPGDKKQQLYMEYCTIRHYAYSQKIDFKMWKLELIMEHNFQQFLSAQVSLITIKIISITPLQSASQSH